MHEHQYPAFFTATILSWKHVLKPDKYKQIIIDSLRFLVENNRVIVYGFVIMPNHLHLIWKIMPPFSKSEVQRDFLKFTGQYIKNDIQKNHPAVLEKLASTQGDRKYQIWERNSLSIYCYSNKVILEKLTYIHNNPIQPHWNLAHIPEDYYYSSARFYEFNQDAFGFLTHYSE
ncbi:transposase [Siphonobacter sp. BAB-5405]|uniref:transposase n=1 Tax=Siphonobacter sp. BAB-5405 TaxID=1864825 RepID=UPI000C809AAE|nr:transposase [Siphonobacter sp. BAB-5405]PMD99533.1 transposase [Siphonobacter sp. BAB-5405]